MPAKAKVPCNHDEELIAKTGRCAKKCKPGFVRNPVTSRCTKPSSSSGSPSKPASTKKQNHGAKALKIARSWFEEHYHRAPDAKKDKDRRLLKDIQEMLDQKYSEAEIRANLWHMWSDKGFKWVPQRHDIAQHWYTPHHQRSATSSTASSSSVKPSPHKRGNNHDSIVADTMYKSVVNAVGDMHRKLRDAKILRMQCQHILVPISHIMLKPTPAICKKD